MEGIAELSTSHLNRAGKLNAELDYQAKRASGIGAPLPTPDHIVAKYKRCRFWRLFPAEFVFSHLGEIDQKELLDFGCGDGSLSAIMARLGGRVTALDISPELIEIAKKRAHLDGVSEQIQFMLADISESQLPANEFDFVVCNLVLHHVDFGSVFPLLLASLKPCGTAIILEPIAFSSSLQRIRNLVPIDKRASPGERQLTKSDVSFIVAELVHTQLTYFNLFGRLRRLFPNRHKKERGFHYPITNTCLFLLYALDRILLTFFPALSRFCANIAIVGQKPLLATASRSAGMPA